MAKLPLNRHAFKALGSGEITGKAGCEIGEVLTASYHAILLRNEAIKLFGPWDDIVKSAGILLELRNPRHSDETLAALERVFTRDALFGQMTGAATAFSKALSGSQLLIKHLSSENEPLLKGLKRLEDEASVWLESDNRGNPIHESSSWYLANKIGTDDLSNKLHKAAKEIKNAPAEDDCYSKISSCLSSNDFLEAVEDFLETTYNAQNGKFASPNELFELTRKFHGNSNLKRHG